MVVFQVVRGMWFFLDCVVSDYVVVSFVIVVLWRIMHGFCNTGFEAVGVEVTYVYNSNN